jgi:DNA-binding CsgD family transcriptional regulator
MATTLPCTTVDPEIFHAPFGERTDSPSAYARINRAVDTCLSCPQMLPCRDWARERHEWGIWGGETDDERTAAGFAPLAATVIATCDTPTGAQRHRRSGEALCRLRRDDERARSAQRRAADNGRLYRRERVVIAAMAEGMTVWQIAADLGATVKAVQSSQGRLRRILNAPTEGLVAAARAAGLLPATAADLGVAA